MAIAYPYDGTLYLALTRRCTLACTFCPKSHGRYTVAGNDMRRDPEPSATEVLDAVDRLGAEDWREVAFVGLGEPTLRLPVLTQVGRALRDRGLPVRLVTDGLANLRHREDVSAELRGAVDEVHVSLNAPDRETYARLCPNRHGPEAHDAVCAFIRKVRDHVPAVRATVVAVPGLDLSACRDLADRLDVPLRIRPYFDPEQGEPHEAGAVARS